MKSGKKETNPFVLRVIIYLKPVSLIKIRPIMSDAYAVEMEILGLSNTPGSSGAYALILTEKGGSRRLPIIIGAFEAQAIALELENIKPPRPMTHDLVKNILLSFDSYVDSIHIHELSEGTFFARIRFERNGDFIDIDSRPSDAIAVAIRFNAKILVAEAVLEEAGIETEIEMDEMQVSADSSSESPELLEQGSTKSPLDMLNEELQTAIETENYEKAARLRDQIQKLKG